MKKVTGNTMFFLSVYNKNIPSLKRYIEQDPSLVNTYDKEYVSVLMRIGTTPQRPELAHGCPACDEECEKLLNELEPFLEQAKKEVVEKGRKNVIWHGMQQINYGERTKLYRENLQATAEYTMQCHEQLRFFMWCLGVGVDPKVHELCRTSWMEKTFVQDYWPQLVCLCMSAPSVLVSDYEPLLQYIHKEESEMKWHCTFCKKSIIDFEHQQDAVEHYEQELLLRRLALDVKHFLMPEKKSLLETIVTHENDVIKKHFCVLFAGRPFCKEFEVRLEKIELKDIVKVCDIETMLMAMKFRSQSFISLFKKMNLSHDTDSVALLTQRFLKAFKAYKVWYAKGAQELMQDLIERKLLDKNIKK